MLPPFNCYPRNYTTLRPRCTLSAPASRCAASNAPNNSLRFAAPCSCVAPPVATSSIKHPALSPSPASPSAHCMALWKAGGPFLTPNGSLVHTKSSSGVQTPVQGILPSASEIYQNPLLRSSFEKVENYPTFCTTSFMLGIGCESRRV